MIGEETSGTFRTYHFDYRGSTVALTNINGAITDTFEYDTYGKFTHRTGSTKILFMYNGRDGVVTDDNGLIYMRARYYSPELRRFVNADIIAGSIVNAITLNRYAYANANPVSFVDPLGLSVERSIMVSNTINNLFFNTSINSTPTPVIKQKNSFLKDTFNSSNKIVPVSLNYQNIASSSLKPLSAGLGIAGLLFGVLALLGLTGCKQMQKSSIDNTQAYGSYEEALDAAYEIVYNSATSSKSDTALLGVEYEVDIYYNIYDEQFYLTNPYTDGSSGEVRHRALIQSGYDQVGMVHYHPRSDEEPPIFSQEDKNVAYQNEIATHIIDADYQTNSIYDYVKWEYSDLVYQPD